MFGGHDKAMGHYRRYNKDELTAILNQTKFKTIKNGYWNISLFFPILFLRIIKKTFFRSQQNHTSDAKPLPSFINNLLFKILNFDNCLILKSINLPIGLSIYGIYKK
jgi:hypothetical protein